ncbi:MAG: DUF3052 domain-containing protein [Acidobacteria bacterium]|nr:DUF3052 domain-containing protein [Acidobacteriota bacterium]
MSAYADTPLARKLGIKAGSKVALLDPPRAFYQALGPLPEDAQLVEGMEKNCHLAIWFARDRGDLRQRPPRCDCPLWIAWPKQASEHASDLTQQRVREFGLGAGLVDYKICSIDKTWSGLLFRRRQAKRK